MIKAVIFDMDGVIIDSEIEYARLWKEFLKENGVHVSLKELRFLAGSSREQEDRYIARKLNLSVKEAAQEKNNFYQLHKIDYRSIQKKHIHEVLNWLRERKITIALASSSPMSTILDVLYQCELFPYFSALVSGEMFSQTKPDPSIYEYTVKKLNLDKNEVLVVEDSEYGIEAGKNAGLRVTALYDSFMNFDVSKADDVIQDLLDLITLMERDR